MADFPAHYCKDLNDFASVIELDALGIAVEVAALEEKYENRPWETPGFVYELESHANSLKYTAKKLREIAGSGARWRASTSTR